MRKIMAFAMFLALSSTGVKAEEVIECKSANHLLNITGILNSDQLIAEVKVTIGDQEFTLEDVIYDRSGDGLIIESSSVPESLRLDSEIAFIPSLFSLKGGKTYLSLPMDDGQLVVISTLIKCGPMTAE